MTPQQTRGFAHFMALFLAAFGGWVAFSMVNANEAYPVAGAIVAGLIAYGGTLVAMRATAAHDLRPTYRPNAHIYETARFPTVMARPSRLVTHPPGAPRYEVDAAAGD
jgi:hypothetical protein